MILLAFLALTLAGVAISALLRSLTLSRSRIAAHLDNLGAYGYTANAPALSPQDTAQHDSPLTSIAGRLGTIVARRIGTTREHALRKLLKAAGMYSTSTRTLLGYRVLGAALLAGLGMLMGGGNIALRITMTSLFTI